ncbi:MAG: S8 family serine peptidase, partial [Acidimicrobiales bacterium]
MIVTLEDTAGDPASVATDLLSPLGGQLGYVYTDALRGFSASLPQALLATLLGDARVKAIQLDNVVSIVGSQSPTPSWGLDRIDQRNRPVNNTYNYTSTGAGVKAYVIDTGIQFNHPDFGGRAVSGFDAIDGGPADDCNGHGTHVAGTIGGTAYGVAKQATLVGVRVLNCQGSGTTSQVVAGINWSIQDHQAGQPAVSNMSLGGGADS